LTILEEGGGGWREEGGFVKALSGIIQKNREGFRV
jgi:hypothetical protein